jgi:hypothetical protein
MILLALVGFVLTSQTAFATNESDYEQGRSLGNSVYSCFYDSQCTTVSSGNGTQECSDYTHGSDPVINTTACFHGFVAGWKHWCKVNTKECAESITNGVFPGSQALAHIKIDEED